MFRSLVFLSLLTFITLSDAANPNPSPPVLTGTYFEFNGLTTIKEDNGDAYYLSLIRNDINSSYVQGADLLLAPNTNITFNLTFNTLTQTFGVISRPSSIDASSLNLTMADSLGLTPSTPTYCVNTLITNNGQTNFNYTFRRDSPFNGERYIQGPPCILTWITPAVPTDGTQYYYILSSNMRPRAIRIIGTPTTSAPTPTGAATSAPSTTPTPSPTTPSPNGTTSPTTPPTPIPSTGKNGTASHTSSSVVTAAAVVLVAITAMRV